MKTLWGVWKGFSMSRNEFDASHRCSAKGDEEVSFTVYIGSPPICPSCRETLASQPLFMKADGEKKFQEHPQNVEESEKKV